MSILHHLDAMLDAVDGLVQTATAWAAEAVEPSPSERPSPSLNTSGIRNFIITKVVPILLAVIGVLFISRANKGRISEVLSSSVIVFIGIAFIVGATTLLFFGGQVVELILPAP